MSINKNMVGIYGTFVSGNDVLSTWSNDINFTLDDAISASEDDTDRLSEGASNLYFTNARVDSIIADGTQITWTYTPDVSLIPEITINNSVPVSRMINGSSAQVIVASSGGVATWRGMSGDALISNTGVVTVVNDSHTHDTRYYEDQETDSFAAAKKNTFTENTGFNKNFGTASGTVAEGDHTHPLADITGIDVTQAARSILYWLSGATFISESNESIIFNYNSTSDVVHFMLPYMVDQTIDRGQIRVKEDSACSSCRYKLQFIRRWDDGVSSGIGPESGDINFLTTFTDHSWSVNASHSNTEHGMELRVRRSVNSTSINVRFTSITIRYL